MFLFTGSNQQKKQKKEKNPRVCFEVLKSIWERKTTRQEINKRAKGITNVGERILLTRQGNTSHIQYDNEVTSSNFLDFNSLE